MMRAEVGELLQGRGRKRTASTEPDCSLELDRSWRRRPVPSLSDPIPSTHTHTPHEEPGPLHSLCCQPRPREDPVIGKANETKAEHIPLLWVTVGCRSETQQQQQQDTMTLNSEERVFGSGAELVWVFCFQFCFVFLHYCSGSSSEAKL